MVFLLIKFFVEIPYQWITVTHLLLQQPHFHPSLCPRRAWVLLEQESTHIYLASVEKMP